MTKKPRTVAGEHIIKLIDSLYSLPSNNLLKNSNAEKIVKIRLDAIYDLDLISHHAQERFTEILKKENKK